MHNATIQRRATTQTGVDPGRELLQARMSLFGRIGAAFSAVYLVLVNAFPTEPKSWQDILFCTSNGIILAVATVFLLAWLLTRAATIEGRMLLAVDTAAIVLVGLLTAAYGWLTIRELSFSYNGVLAITNAMCFRAALIPSSARRTLLVGLAATLPTVSLALAHTLMPAWSVLGSGMLGFVLAWCAVGVGISTVISGVIFGLQQQARRAERLGQYELMERIGAGAMGEVYRARHAMLRRPTAIKLLQPRIAGAGNILRFEREVQHTAALTHPNTVAIYDYGRTPDGLFYYAMEFLDGTDLQRLVDGEGPQPPGRVLHILRQICGSLTEAHEAGLVHRDVKAANVFLCERGGVADVVKVLDFGLVLHADDARERALAGTPTYLAPECIQQPGTVSTLADIYAVGVLAYVLLTGRTPIGGSSVDEILANQVSLEPRPPSHHLRQDLPEELERIVMACLAKDPGDRPTSARKLGAMLAACTVEGDHRPAASAPAAAPDALMAAETIMPDEV
jgi:hypothetical protein